MKQAKMLAILFQVLTKRKIRSKFNAHLDPDLIRDSMPRLNKWRPVLGQIAAAQGHLRNQNIRPGDLFFVFRIIS